MIIIIAVLTTHFISEFVGQTEPLATSLLRMDSGTRLRMYIFNLQW